MYKFVSFLIHNPSFNFECIFLNLLLKISLAMRSNYSLVFGRGWGEV
nr:MAG TPA_asm: hypothetical protein [Caudoviricetes sp.]